MFSAGIRADVATSSGTREIRRPRVRPGEDAARTPTVIVVNDAAHVTGGAGKVALSSAIALSRAGYEVVFFAAQGPIAPDLSSEPRLRVVCLDQCDILTDANRLRAATQGLWNARAQRTFRSLLRQFDPASTVVHLHGWTKALSPSVIHATKAQHFPLIITLHDYFIACPIGSLYLHGRKEICTLRPMSARCVAEHCDSRSYAHKLWRVTRQLVQNAAVFAGDFVGDVIVVSDLSASVLAPHLRGKATMHRISNPIDVDRAECVDVRRNWDFSYIGRLSAEKGASLFARAAAAAGVPAVFVGDGECAANVRAENSRTRITGWVEHSAVQRHLRRARAVVVPSLWYENAPLVVLEAAALGIPAIVSDTCAAREDLVDGETGLIFRSGDPDSLARALRQLSNDAYAERLGKAAYDRYWRNPRTLDQHVAALGAVYVAMTARVPRAALVTGR